MNIVYLASMRLPTERAHGIQIMAMCEALAESGHQVTLVVPNRATKLLGDPHEYYGVKKNFTIERVPALDIVRWGKVGFMIYLLSFGLACRRWLSSRKFDLVFSRDELPLSLVAPAAQGAVLVWESHRGSYNRWVRSLIAYGAKMVVISNGLAKYYLAKGISRERMLVAHDAVKLSEFQDLPNQDEARQEFALPSDRYLVMYVGSLEEWKGYKTLLKAAKKLPEKFLVVCVGGAPEQVASLKELYPNVQFFDYRPSKEVPRIMQAADLLVIPNTAQGDLSAHFTSPLKVFTAMASGVPIVASDIPSLHEVLDETTANYFEADNPSSLAEQIVKIETDQTAPHKATKAKIKVAELTWYNRAKQIIEFTNRTT